MPRGGGRSLPRGRWMPRRGERALPAGGGRSLPRGGSGEGSLVGRDVARMPARFRRRRRPLPWVLGGLLAALALAALRVDLIRLQYGLASAMKEEKALLVRHRELTAEVRRLRDPARLAQVGSERGFGLPERVIELPEPAPEGSAAGIDVARAAEIAKP